MPYYRRRYRRRPMYRRRRYKKKAIKKLSKNTKLLTRNRRVVTTCKTGPERKYIDRFANGVPSDADNAVRTGSLGTAVAFTTAWQFKQLTSMAQGVESFNRVGLKACLKSLIQRYIVRLQQTNPGATDPRPYIGYRIVVFLWNTEDAPTAGVSDDTDVFTNDDPISLFNPRIPGGRLIVLFDTGPRYISPAVLNAYTSGSASGVLGETNTHYHNFYKKMDVEISWGSASPDDYKKGHIFVGYINDIAGTDLVMRYYSRVRFTDE